MEIEKNKIINLIQNIKNNFKKNNINDYYNVIYLTKKIFESQEQDLDILKEFFCLLDAVTEIHQSNIKVPTNKNDISKQKFNQKNNIDEDLLVFLDKQYASFSEPIRELLSYRIFIPESMNQSYHTRLE